KALVWPGTPEHELAVPNCSMSQSSGLMRWMSKLSTSSISTSSVDHSPVSPTSAASLQNGLSSNSKVDTLEFSVLVRTSLPEEFNGGVH
ncbi:hypothetical protein TYRP_002311, partial [Tyrophagus putrescentiae]